MLTFIYTTLATEAEALEMAESLVEKKLAVCAQVGGLVRSQFRWRGQTDSATEAPLLIKTGPEKQEACIAYIQTAHPYETPAIEWWTVNTTSATQAWAAHELA